MKEYIIALERELRYNKDRANDLLTACEKELNLVKALVNEGRTSVIGGLSVNFNSLNRHLGAIEAIGLSLNYIKSLEE